MNTQILSASTISGINVKNMNREDIGKIQDLMVNLETGEVTYAVLSFGGFLGIGDKYFAVPLQALNFTIKDGNREIFLDVSKERLEDAPGFDKNHWPNEANHEFVQSVYNYYGYSRPARERTFVNK